MDLALKVVYVSRSRTVSAKIVTPGDTLAKACSSAAVGGRVTVFVEKEGVWSGWCASKDSADLNPQTLVIIKNGAIVHITTPLHRHKSARNEKDRLGSCNFGGGGIAECTDTCVCWSDGR